MVTATEMPDGPQMAYVRRLLLWIIAGGLTLILVLSLGVPWQPRMPSEGLDDSWMFALHAALENGFQFGENIIFPFGPFGFLYTLLYYPSTFPFLLLGWIFFALVLWWGSWRIGARHLGSPWLFLFWFLGLLGIVVATPIRDVFFVTLVIQFVLYYFFIDDYPWSLTTLLFLCTLALASLVKVNVLTLVLPLMVIVSTHGVVKNRQFPWIFLAYVMAVMGFWMLGHQHITALMAFLRGTYLLSQGYTEAMSVNASWGEVWHFLGTTAAFIALVLYVEWRRRRYWALWPLAALTLIILFLFKHGFVRQLGHSFLAWLSFLAMVLLYAPLLRNSSMGRAGQLSCSLVLLAVLAMGWYGFDRYPKPSLPGLADQLRTRFQAVDDSLRAASEVTFGRDHLLEDYDKALTRIKLLYPIPAVKGFVDVYPIQQAVVLAHRLPWRPRPVFQSYAAYTTTLADMNAQHLRDGESPATILFDIATIDNRFPSLDDGLSWPDLLTRYHLSKVSGSFIVFERDTKPRTFQLTPLLESVAALHTSVSVPEFHDAPIWTRIDIEPTFIGRLMAFLFKPPEVHITVTTHDGSERKFRLIPAMAKTGFLLSPLIDNRFAFAAFASRDRHSLSGQTVSNIALSGSGRFKWFFKPTIKIAFFRLDFPMQDSPLPREARDIARLLTLSNHGESPYGLRPTLLAGPQAQPMLSAPAPLKMTLPLSDRVDRLTVGFGMFDQTWMAGGRTDGVDFRILSVDTNKHQKLIWSRYLDPLNSSVDRGMQHVTIQVPMKPKALIFETLPGPQNNTDWDSAYWAEITLN